MRSSQTLDEKQAMMRDRVRCRPCKDGRSRQAHRARARLIKLEDVVPRTQDFVVKRRAARFMLSRNFSREYVANQLGLSLARLEEMLRGEPERCPSTRTKGKPESNVRIGPSEGARNLLRQQEREKRREAKSPLSRLCKPENEVTFVTAFAGEVEALTDREEADRRSALADVREREARDAGEGRPR